MKNKKSGIKFKKMIFPVVVILVWMYFMLKNTFWVNLSIIWDLSFNKVWPVLLVIYGIYIIIWIYDSKK